MNLKKSPAHFYVACLKSLNTRTEYFDVPNLRHDTDKDGFFSFFLAHPFLIFVHSIRRQVATCLYDALLR